MFTLIVSLSPLCHSSHFYVYIQTSPMLVFRFLKSNNQVVPDGGSLLDTNFAGKVEKFVFFLVRSSTTRFGENLEVGLYFKLY
jgi:hypothetical protein